MLNRLAWEMQKCNKPISYVLYAQLHVRKSRKKLIQIISEKPDFNTVKQLCLNVKFSRNVLIWISQLRKQLYLVNEADNPAYSTADCRYSVCDHRCREKKYKSCSKQFSLVT